MPIPIYTIHNLFIKKNGDTKLAIKQFDIHRGACYIFDGKMGVGKTTFIETLYNRNKIPNAKIIFEEKDIYRYRLKDYLEQIAVVPQTFKAPWGTVNRYMFKSMKQYSYINNVKKRIDDISKK